ncbi:MAG: hypothetical protein Kow0099_16440 [Candidatus Abyssubacteria bacterium]
MRNKPTYSRSVFLFVYLTLAAWPGFVHAQQGEYPGGGQFLEGRRLQHAREWAASIEQFRAASEAYSLVPDYALYQIAQSAYEMGDTQLAAEALEKMLSLYPDTPVRRRGQLELASIYYENGKPAQAASLIENALPGAESPREIVDLLLMLANAYAKSENFPKADSVSWQLIHSWSSTPEALEATELVRAPDTPFKRFAIAKVYLKNKKTEKALKALDKLIDDANAAELMPELLIHKAMALEHKGDRSAAIALYNRVAGEFPDSSFAATAIFRRAMLKKWNGLFEAAAADFELLLQTFPSSEHAPAAVRERAKIFERMNDPAEYEEYARLLDKYPDAALAHPTGMYWGVKLFRARDYLAACSVFERLLSLNLGHDAHADAAFWIAKCHAADGRVNSAKVRFANIIGRYRETFQAYRARAILQVLNQADSEYANEPVWKGIIGVERVPFVSLENATPVEAFELLEKELSFYRERDRLRLRFLMCNELSETEWELRRLLREVSGDSGKYALAWALFHFQAYNDGIRVASSLRDRFSDDTRATRVLYLLYPPAYTELVREAASRYRVEPALALAVMREESHFREDAVSVSDARGLMQILPTTGEWLAKQLAGPGAYELSALFVPTVNIEMGSYYLRYLLDKFDNNIVLTIAAYNWGETSLRRWLGDNPPSDLDVLIESIPADETRKYVKKVLRSYAVYNSLYPSEFLGIGS